MKKGSALIISLLVITAITAAIFGAASLTVLELRQARRAEDSQIAFYAAEAGIERGLLEFRKERSQEWLANQTVNGLATGVSANWTSQFKGAQFSKSNIGQDEAVEINTAGLGRVTLIWTWADAIVGTRQGIEIIVLKNDGSKDIIKSAPSAPDYSLDLAGQGKSIRVVPLVSGVSNGLGLSSLTVNPVSGFIDTGTTTITSTGVAGSVQRQLVATVDRQSGALVSVFDYALVTTSSTPIGDIKGQ